MLHSKNVQLSTIGMINTVKIHVAPLKWIFWALKANLWLISRIFCTIDLQATLSKPHGSCTTQVHGQSSIISLVTHMNFRKLFHSASSITQTLIITLEALTFLSINRTQL